jgi:hypothetical protein
MEVREPHSLLGRHVLSSRKSSDVRHGPHGTRNLPSEPLNSSEPLARHRAVITFRIILFVGGMGILASLHAGGDSKNDFAVRLLDRIQDHQAVQITEVAKSNSAEDWVNPSSPRYKLNLIGTSTEPSPISPKVLAFQGQLVQEFWRSMVSSDVIGRYDSYLRDYPSGTFADLATARIKDLRNVTTEVSVTVVEDRTTGNPENIRPSKTVKRKASAKALTVKPSPSKGRGRCWSGNIDGCKERCRAGEIRACQKIRRLGD